jgi:hypothetical protein
MKTKIKGFIEVNVDSSKKIKVLINILNIVDVTSTENDTVITTDAGAEGYIRTIESYDEIISLIKEATDI